MDGLIIRGLNLSDAQAIYDLYSCPTVIRDTLQVPYSSLDDWKRRLQERPATNRWLVAELDGRVIGDVTLEPRRNRQAHAANLGIAVHDDFQGRGIGQELMAGAMDLADNWLHITRVELMVFADNARAIHIYKKSGFQAEGTHRAFAFREGKYADVLSMARVTVRESDRL